MPKKIRVIDIESGKESRVEIRESIGFKKVYVDDSTRELDRRYGEARDEFSKKSPWRDYQDERHYAQETLIWGAQQLGFFFGVAEEAFRHKHRRYHKESIDPCIKSGLFRRVSHKGLELIFPVEFNLIEASESESI